MPMLRIIRNGPPRGMADTGGRLSISCARTGGQRAEASFEPGPTATAAVGYVTESAEGRVRVTGWVPPGKLRAMRAILARGGPLHLVFDLRDPGAHVGYLRRIGLIGPGGVLATVTAAAAHPADADVAPPSRFAMPL